jgi:hypothetical protein
MAIEGASSEAMARIDEQLTNAQNVINEKIQLAQSQQLEINNQL